MDRAVAAGHVLVAGAGELGHAPAELGAVADPVDQAGAQRRPRHVAAGRGDEAGGVGDIGRDLRPRPRLMHVLLPAAPERVGQRLGILARLGRHVAAGERLDRRFERADAVDVGGDAEPLEQAGIIKVGAARPRDHHRAQRIEPDLVGMGGELVAVVAIAGGVGDDALVRAPEPVERRADVGDRGLAAAGEDVEVERDRLDAVVGRGRVERVDELADAVLAGEPAAADQVERVAHRRLLDDRAGKIEPERAARGAVLIGACRQRGVEPAEKGEHEQQHQAVLDPDQQLPRFACELHRPGAPCTPRG